MRLIKINDDGTLSLTKDLHDDSIPPYAILSHTWGADDEELTYQDLCSGTGREKAGYAKLDFCVQQAKKDGLEYCWIDTCCIDKANMTELSKAINSMFHWYQASQVCYVYLSDVTGLKRTADDDFREAWHDAFRGSKWFTRAWTFQELLAPANVRFFSRDQSLLGCKQTLGVMIGQVTGIPAAALQCYTPGNWSISERMQWRAGRKATHVEDEAYSLLGIFGVHMPLLYAEGSNAWKRLKDEIAKSVREELDKTVVGAIPGESSTPDRISWEALIASLKFEQMEARRSTIKKADSSTCDWLLDHPSFKTWLKPDGLDRDGSVLWINGKPGCGKSTLMKHLHKRAKGTRSHNETVLGFYFNARGNELEKSTLGMYRSLLFQMMTQLQGLQNTLTALINTPGQRQYSGIWTIALLHEMLMTAADSLPGRKLKLYIDALDECDEQEVRDMIIFFEDLAEKASRHKCQIYICFASRHYPAIEIRSGSKITLEEEKGHNEDLVKYVCKHLRSGTGKQVESIRAEICEKANSVFLWAVLVVDILNAEYRSGRIFAVKKRLKEIPPKLHELFINIIKRDTVNLDELLLSLQWILFAKRPLKRAEYYYAMASGLDPTGESLDEWDSEHITLENMTKYVQASSRGFAELTRDKDPTVQFIHESVRDFLLKDGGLSHLLDSCGLSVESSSHDRLKSCCNRYLANRPTLGLERHMAYTNQARALLLYCQTRLPFLQYSVHFMLYHSDKAAYDISPEDFIRQIDLRSWIRLANVFVNFECMKVEEDARLAYVLVWEDHAALLTMLIKLGVPLYEPGQEHYIYPFFAAIVGNNLAALRVLICSESYPKPDFAELDKELGRFVINAQGLTPLCWALQRGYQALAENLMARPSCISPQLLNVECNLAEMEEAVMLAARKGFQGIVKQLLHALSWSFRTNPEEMLLVLSCAAFSGSLEMMCDLWSQRPWPAAEAPDLTHSLHMAAEGGHKAAVKLLLDWEADVNASLEGRIALVLAAAYGHHDVVELLLDWGAGIDVTGKVSGVDIGDTALHFAIEQSHPESVKVLLSRGAGVLEISDGCSSIITLAACLEEGSVMRTVLAHCIATDDCATYLKTTLLSEDISGWSWQSIQVLLEHGTQLEASDSSGNTPLLKIVESQAEYPDSIRAITHLLHLGADLEARNQNGSTPLLVAVKNRQWQLAKELIEHGADSSGHRRRRRSSGLGIVGT
ncbi:hypothetical protein LTR86_009219 [Recurvomyces mirabilis]|nr:hypothetical protein LTR86_009219 [Recurvomyces mirabilis]